jgi:hypothetical protein
MAHAPSIALVGAFCGLAVAACGGGARSDRGGLDVDAGVASAMATRPSSLAHAGRAMRVLAGSSAFSSRLRDARTLRRVGDHLRSVPPSDLGRWSAPAALAARLPVRADGPLHLALARDPEFSVDLVDRDARSLEGVASDGAWAFAGDARSTVVQLVDRTVVEELRVYFEAPPVVTVRYGARLGRAVASVRARDGRIELLDARGSVGLASEPLFAVDAAGVRRVPALRIEGEGDATTIVVSLATDGLVTPIVLDPAWTQGPPDPAGAMGGRALADLGYDGLYVVGGFDGSSISTSSKVDLWTCWPCSWLGYTYEPSTPRSGATFTALSTGTALLIGGQTGSFTAGFGVTGTAELFNPNATFGHWLSSGTMATPRVSHSATLLAGDNVLVAGGSGATVLSTAELWAAGTFTVVGAMHAPREYHTATVLPGGKVLIAGGADATPSDTSAAELFDPSAKLFSVASSMHVARSQHAAALLSSGKVLVVGGASAKVSQSSAELYDPATDAWTLAAPMSVPRTGATVAVLENDRVLVVGGFNGTTPLSSTEIYDAASNAWTSAPSLTLARGGQLQNVKRAAAGTVLGGVGVTVFGGSAYGVALAAPESITFSADASTCAADGDCASGHCVDGVCCASVCSGACQACNRTAGTCTTVTSGAPVGARSCGSYAACTATGCATSCAVDADCVATAYCAGSVCVARTVLAGACTSDHQCLSGHCADGVCCDKACNGQCEACDLATTVGTCNATLGAPHGTRTPCAAGGYDCASACDGTNRTACGPGPSGLVCGTSACVGGVERHVGKCDGAGSCADGAKSCGGFACGASACKVTCAANADCAAGYFCSSGSCAPVAGLGVACAAASDCATGFCTDGVCCAQASCGTGKTCAAPGNAGTCKSVNGTACTVASECGSQRCVDHVCCASFCNGQCEACDVPDHLGTCAPVTHAPHGARQACFDGGGNVCMARACDGADSAFCSGYAKAQETPCAPARCDGEALVPESVCDGAGGCAAPKSVACTPFRCVDAACATGCTTDDQCASGYHCAGGTCLQGATCSADRRSSVPKGGGAPVDCAPYLCISSGDCGKVCSTSDDCTPGNACDPTAKTCLTADAAGASSGGCALDRGRAPSAAAVGLLALLALSASVGRRRTSARRRP